MKKPKIGLALGSGGARGLSHIGVIKVLQKHNISIDLISGCSIGSVAGAYFSLNKEVNTLEQRMLKFTKREVLKFFDICSPKRAIISGKKVTNFIKELVGDKTFNDLHIPLKIITTDLSSGEEIVLDKGNLLQCIRASISLPGILPPVKMGNTFLIDGGVVNPTPIDIVKQMGADIVIGVDLTMTKPVKLQDPNIIQILIQSLEILRSQTIKSRINQNKNAIIITPISKSKIDTYKFHETSKFIKEGELVAEKIIPKIKEQIKNFR